VGKKVFLLLAVFTLYSMILPAASAQEQTGSLRVVITDTEGFPLPGAFVYIDSSSMMDIRTYITSETGTAKFRDLPPGAYKLSVEMPGFKTVNIDRIIIHTGKTVRLRIPMEITTVEEEIFFPISSPTGDFLSAKTAAVIDEPFLRAIPVERNLHAVLSLVPGRLADTRFFPLAESFHGASARSNLYTVDGMNWSDPLGHHLLTSVNLDTVEEVEVVTGGMPVQLGPLDGGYVNVVLRSGGNNPFGEARIFHTAENLTNSLLSGEEEGSSEAVPPVKDKKLWDFSLTFGGPILRDNLWFFTNARLFAQARTTPFSAWTDPQGEIHDPYEWENKEKAILVKLNSQFVPNLKVSGLFQYTNRNRPFQENEMDWGLTPEAARNMDHDFTYLANGLVNYVFDQDTFVDLRAGIIQSRMPLLLQDTTVTSPSYVDEATGYRWGSGPFNENRLRRRFQAGVFLTRFQDSVLGADHEIQVGGEYAYSGTEWSVWKEDNLTVHYNNGSPYMFGTTVSPFSGNPVGKGKVSFSIASRFEGQFIPSFEIRRLSLAVRDTATFAHRLTLTLGLRFDRSLASQLGITKDISGNPLSLALGDALIEPFYGVNPFVAVQIFPWKNMITWNALSPHVGLVFDLFGDGKTLLEASYSRYPERMRLEYPAGASPFYPLRSHSFFWYDEDLDGEVDTQDAFSLSPQDYRFYAFDYSEKRIAADIGPPRTDEFTVGLHQEIFPDFSLQVTYLYRDKTNFLEDVLYEPDSGTAWYTTELDQEGWWQSFQTIVPGNNDYKNTPVTVYFPSAEAPLPFTRLQNVPELRARYRGLEVSFRKRMSHNWQLSGSIVVSKATGNIGSAYAAGSGFTPTADNPNCFVNLREDSPSDFDRPFVARLAGTYLFPYDFSLSFFYTHTSGTPWARSVTIFPPASLLPGESAHAYPATVLLEEPGTRRHKAMDNLNIRIEKSLRFSRTMKMSLILDVFNALGYTYQESILNDGGYWFPEAENTTEGLRVLSPDFKRTVTLVGTRTFRLGLSLTF